MKIRLTSVSISNYDKALKFYTEVLGFVKKRDIPLGHGVRWLTLVSPEEPEGTELLLEPNAKYPAMKALKESLVKDAIPFMAFQVDDIQQEYARLKKLGVQFSPHLSRLVGSCARATTAPPTNKGTLVRANSCPSCQFCSVTPKYSNIRSNLRQDKGDYAELIWQNVISRVNVDSEHACYCRGTVMAVKWDEVAAFNQEKGSDVTVRSSQTFLHHARIQKQMTKTRRSLVVQAQLAFLLCLIVRPALSQNPVWPQFRGPDSNPGGSHQRLPERWSTTENVEWSVEIPGRGWSSPIVTGHRVLLAIRRAEIAVQEGQTPFGAVVVNRSGQLIGEGHNRVRAKLDPAAHGEIVAIRDASRPGADCSIPLGVRHHRD